MFGLFKRKGDPAPEKRASGYGSGFTAEVVAARESYLIGRRGLGELTATVQACIGMWESGLALADVSGTDLLDRATMGLLARSVALRGEALFLIRPEGLALCSDWDMKTRYGKPTAYRVTINEAGGGRTETALAAEVLHVRIGADIAAPWTGRAPLRRAAVSAELLHEIEAGLRDVFRDAPLGSQIVHLPEGSAEDAENLRAAFRGRRGSSLVVEGVAQATAAGMNPNLGRAPDSLSPDLEKAATKETLAAARDAICAAFGVLPGLFNPATTGPMVREAQRHLATWQLQPLAALLAEEASDKLGATVEIDVLTPLQAFDAGGRARALSAVVQTMATAKEAGLSAEELDAAMTLVNWGRDDNAA